MSNNSIIYVFAPNIAFLNQPNSVQSTDFRDSLPVHGAVGGHEPAYLYQGGETMPQCCLQTRFLSLFLISSCRNAWSGKDTIVWLISEWRYETFHECLYLTVITTRIDRYRHRIENSESGSSISFGAILLKVDNNFSETFCKVIVIERRVLFLHYELSGRYIARAWSLVFRTL